LVFSLVGTGTLFEGAGELFGVFAGATGTCPGWLPGCLEQAPVIGTVIGQEFASLVLAPSHFLAFVRRPTCRIAHVARPRVAMKKPWQR
jgi:hypothetical protein